MTRLGSLSFCAALAMGAALLSCGGGSGGEGGTGGGGGVGGSGGAGVGGTEAVLAIVPGDGTVGGWVRDPSDPLVANKAAAIAVTMQEAVDLIDGGADPYYQPPAFSPNVFAWQNYKNTTVNPPDGYTIKMYILQMPTADQAAALYGALVDGSHSLYSSTPEPWTDMSPAIGDASRIVNSGIDWWINFRKGVYYGEVFLGYAEKTDAAGKQQTIDFVNALAAKM
ncbi:MAG: hypothetical protein JXP73_11570 [Deltaproteobacteria bacterium]|nr:hypothetical protein [Deltaproteobacteria bacterium]